MSLLRILPWVALLAACSGEPPPPPLPPKVLVMTAAEGGARSAGLAGEVRARHEFDLGFRVGGKLIERRVDAGARVRAGEVLARLDPADLQLAAAAAQAQVRAAETDARIAEADRQRQADLLKRQFISQAAYDARTNAATAAQERLAQAKAQAALSSNQTAYGDLVSTSDAVVTAVLADAGQVISAGAPVLKLARLGEMEIAVAVPEARLAEFRAANSFSVQLWALPGQQLAASLRELAPAADAATRTYAARLSLKNPPADLRLGMTATVDAAESGKSPLLLPSTALVDRGDGPRVWVVVDGKVQLRAVSVGPLRDEGVVIHAGLAANEPVVVLGTDQLAEGMAVRAEMKRPPAGQH